MSEARTQADVYRERQLESLRRTLGEDILGFLEDPRVVEIMLNQDGQVWVDILGGGMEPRSVMDPIRAKMMIETVASILDTSITKENPIISGELPLDGSRFEAQIPPIVLAPTFAIRKKALLIFTLDDYVEKGILTAEQKERLIDAVRNRKNILVSGGTGSGKSTAANAVLDAVRKETPEHRIVVIEDTRELQVSVPNVVSFRTSDEIDMTRLLKSTMRMRPDRIVVGEVRDGAALALLKAWGTGHPGGISTIHANDALGALTRVDMLMQEAGVPSNREFVAEVIDLVVSIKRTATGRIVDEILAVDGYENGRFLTRGI